MELLGQEFRSALVLARLDGISRQTSAKTAHTALHIVDAFVERVHLDFADGRDKPQEIGRGFIVHLGHRADDFLGEHSPTFGFQDFLHSLSFFGGDIGNVGVVKEIACHNLSLVK